MIAMVYEEHGRAPRLFGDDDLTWIDQLLDIAAASLGGPWRVLVERVERAQLAVHVSHRTAVLGALRRVLGGAAQRGRTARKLRGLVLGPPALDETARWARLTAAGDSLGMSASEVESLLWIDLATERPVAWPGGRPEASELAAVANLDRIQRWVRRAHDLQLRVWDRANDLIRTVARYGLIAHVRREARLGGDTTVLDVMGPLSLFHATTVYGRALAALVPLLAEQPRFALDLRCRLHDEDVRIKLAPPVRLPPVVRSRRRPPSVAQRLASDLEALGHAIEREPPPIASGEHVLFPDLAIAHGGARWLVEVVGFSTREYLASKFERYRRAGAAPVVLCVDLATAPREALEGRICGFTRRVDAAALIATLENGP